MRDLISVIIPSYNHERYIRQAIESVLVQTYDCIEIIIIDDCSKDSTYYVAKGIVEEALSYGRIEHCHLSRHIENAGAHATINEGISLASGRYVTILNSDDYFEPERLEEIISSMLRVKSELGFSLVQAVDAGNNRIKPTNLPPSLTDAFDYIIWAKNAFPTISLAFLARNVAVSTGNIVFSRELYDYLGGFRDYKYIHDWDFALRACLRTEPVFVNRILYNYRLHSSNSFSSLADIGEIEIDQMTKEFFGLIDFDVVNPTAPIPRLWPGVFPMLEDELYLVRRLKTLM